MTGVTGVSRLSSLSALPPLSTLSDSTASVRERFAVARDPGDPIARRMATVQQVVALVAAFLLGLQVVVHGGVTVGDAFAPLLLAVWVPTLARFSGAWLLVVLGLVTVVWGYLLGSMTAGEGYLLNASIRLQTLSELASVIAGVGVLLWVRTVLPTAVLAAAFGLGMVGNAQLFGAVTDNPWKYTWGLPVSVLVLSLATMTNRRAVVCVAIMVLAGVSAALDCRSYGAALALTLVLYVAASRRTRNARDLPTGVVAGFVIALAGAVYYLGQSLLVAGYLGRDAQVRTIDQIETSGSLILGGRPELAATWSLLEHRPAGYGAGVVPTGSDIAVAKQGLAAAHESSISNGYIENYLFGGQIELHSVFGDLWAHFGIPGLVLALVVAVLMLRGIAVFLASRTGGATAILACVWTLWNVGFSPFVSSSAIMTLGLALALPRRRTQPVNVAERRTAPVATASPSEPATSPSSR